MWCVYLLRCGGDRYYLGVTHDLAARLAKHRKGQGSAFTRTHGVVSLVGAVDVGTRAEAMREERRLKRWSTARKVAYFQQHARADPKLGPDPESTSAQSPLIFFLDFDGVLHPLFTFSPDGRSFEIYAGPYLTLAPRLAEILAPYLDQLEIVISSSWGLSRSLNDLKGLLPAVLADRVTDTIWLPGFGSDYRSALATRYGCILIWLQRKRPDHAGRWLALDDDDNGWPDDQRDHLIHAWGTFSTPNVQEQLARRLLQLLGRP